MEWKKVKLGEIVILHDSKRVPLSSLERAKRKGNYPYYGAASIVDYIDSYIFDGDYILLGEDGTVINDNGTPVLQRPSGQFWVSNHAHVITNREGVDFDFLYYLLCNTNITSAVTGAVQMKVSQKNLLNIELPLPPLETQHRIAAILSSLDDKIENNNRINRNLEAQAQALFKSWFVDFEPWGGTMPEDWREGTLGDICKQLKEKVGERDDVKVLSPVTTGKLMLSEEYFTKQVFSQSIAKYIIVPPTAFAYNPARVNIGSLGMNEFDFDGCVSPVYAVFECLDGYEYYFDLFRQTNMFKEEVKLRAIGGVRQSLNYEDFARITCNIPSKDAVEKFNTIYLANLDARNQNCKESSRLATLRDTLLSKLMRGEITL